MTTPALFYSFLIATLLGSAFHFWKGGGLVRLVFLLVLSWTGFYLGHLVGSSWSISFLLIGPVNGGLGIIGSLLLLIVGNWFTQLDRNDH
jgi:hypothetical protein